MSAIIEPEGASWWGTDRWGEKGRITFTANTEDRSVFIRRQYPGQDLQESIELDLGQLAEVEAMLLNARLWLERATKQADELKAAAEIAEDGPQELVCMNCGHPFHARQECEECGCDGHPHCSICEHRERSHYSTLNGCTAITRTGAICDCPGFHLYIYQES